MISFDKLKKSENNIKLLQQELEKYNDEVTIHTIIKTLNIINTICIEAASFYLELTKELSSYNDSSVIAAHYKDCVAIYDGMRVICKNINSIVSSGFIYSEPNGSELDDRHLKKLIYQINVSIAPCFILPPLNNERIIRQRGAFLLFPPLMQDECAKIPSVKYKIPAANKENILKELALIGIDQSYLFPDLENQAKRLKSKYSITS